MPREVLPSRLSMGEDARRTVASIAKDERTLHERWATIKFAREMLEQLCAIGASDDESLSPGFPKYFAWRHPGSAIALERMNLEIDIRGVLPSIRVPTLVVHRTGDWACKIEEGRYVAEHIPGARVRRASRQRSYSLAR